MRNIKTSIVRQVISLSSFFYKNIKYKVRNNFVKVNLGCGLQCLPGWINIDGSLTSLLGSKRFSFINKLLYKLAGSSNYYSFDFYNKVIKESNLKFYDLQKRVPILSNNADIVYCSHFLEHLSKKDGRNFLKECFRILKKDGLIRIAVPDLDIAMTMYQRFEVEKMQDLFFYTSSNWDFAAHKYNYNFTYLREVLSAVGFKDIKKMSYQNGKCPEIDYLDVYPEHSLYVECKK
jgi:predicted SAM-dependent methyltransferase